MKATNIIPRFLKGLLFFLFHLNTIPAFAQNDSRSFTTEKRLALVIGNAKYEGSPLKNPVNDARAMKATLESLGFKVLYYENLGGKEMEEALVRFSSELINYKVGLFYFAGHGFEAKEKINYLMSTDINSNLNEALAKDKSLSLNTVIESIKDRNKTGINLVIIDACRDNPYQTWGRNLASGLGPVYPPDDLVVFFAASPGQKADDNRLDSNGLFTKELLAQIKTPNQELTDILKNTQRAVRYKNNNQTPAIMGTILRDFYFSRSTEIPITPPSPIVLDEAQEPSRETLSELQILQKQIALHKRRTIRNYAIGAVPLVAGTAGYLVVNTKYTTYKNQIELSNAQYTVWYNQNYGKDPVADQLAQPNGLAKFGSPAIFVAGAAVIGGVVLGILGTKEMVALKKTRRMYESKKLQYGFSPMVDPANQWAGMRVNLNF